MTPEKDIDGKSKFAPGQNADGTISMMTVEQARESRIQRDADETAFEGLLDENDYLDDVEALEDDDDEFSDRQQEE